MASGSEGVGLLDTGPLVSFLAAGLEYHAWAVEQWKELRPPLLTCEPVLTEAAFLLKREGRDTDALFTLLERGVIRIAITVEREKADLRALMRRHATGQCEWPTLVSSGSLKCTVRRRWLRWTAISESTAGTAIGSFPCECQRDQNNLGGRCRRCDRSLLHGRFDFIAARWGL